MSDTPEGAPKNVIEAIARVMADLPGIGKDETASAQQGGYKYRGIEQITAAAQKLMGRHGVVFVPHEVTMTVSDPFLINSKPWTDTFVSVVYDVYGPGGLEDRLPDPVGPINAIGRDNTDKGANKARSQAFKYALTQVFCIGDSKDDADAGSPEADGGTSAHPPVGPAFDPAPVLARLAALPDTARDAIVKWIRKAENDDDLDPADIPAESGAWPKITEVIAKAEAKIAGEAAPDSAPPTPPAAGGERSRASVDSPRENGPDTDPPAAAPEYPIEQYVAGIEAYEELLGEQQTTDYFAWLSETFPDKKLADLTHIEAQQVYDHLNSVLSEGAA